MRRTALALAVALVAAPMAEARFGVSKTRVTLSRSRPPQIPILSPEVFVDVVTGPVALPVTPEVHGEAETVWTRVREAIASMKIYRLVDAPGAGASTVTVVLSPPSAGARNVEGSYTSMAPTGGGWTWGGSDGSYMFLPPGVEEQSVSYTRRLEEGRIEARVTVVHGSSTRSSVVSARYSFESPKKPQDAPSAEWLRGALATELGAQAAAVVSYGSEPVVVLLAVNGELQEGNTLAKGGRFEDALRLWSARTLKGRAEAARRHNMAVAHEARAYRLPLESEDHRLELEAARDLYRQAVGLDPAEKYFKESLERLEVSLRYAEAARDLTKHIGDQYAPPDGGATMMSSDSLAPTPR